MKGGGECLAEKKMDDLRHKHSEKDSQHPISLITSKTVTLIIKMH
jgi:hypothetical protein